MGCGYFFNEAVMAEKTKETVEVNLEDFYTLDNEKNGMWYEPMIEGEPIHMEFLMIGIHSDEGVALMEHYDRLAKELKKETDPAIRAEKEAILDAERVASLVKGIRPADGYSLNIKGKSVDFSQQFIKDFLYNVPLVKMDLIQFTVRTANFMNRKKNL